MKLIISKRDCVMDEQKKRKMIEIKNSTHHQIKCIAKETGNSIVDIAEMLIDYALENLEVKE
ncbi:hypothetical protein ACWG0P_13940 [Amedibacillus sp. YH-ame6]